MKKVLIMLSTYNGTQFLSEQIDSILEQKNVEINLLIRDDGSTDDTVKIIESYKDDRITLIKGDNIGVINSFFDLLQNSWDADYYAFSDQDDVWDEMKMYYAIETMENGKDTPKICAGSFIAVDENMNKLSDIVVQSSYSLRKTLVYNAPLGCTEVFNKKLRDLILVGIPSFCRMHDHWVILVAELYNAEILHSEKSKLYYRQHSSNVVAYNANFFTRVKRLVCSASKKSKDRKRQALEALKLHGDRISESNKAVLQQVVSYDDSIYNRIKFAFDINFLKEIQGKRLYYVCSVLWGVF